MGSCVYHVAHRGMLQSMAQTGRNVELPNFTQALYDARELAMERMQTEAQALTAEGIVGVKLNETSHGWGSHTMSFSRSAPRSCRARVTTSRSSRPRRCSI